MIYKLYSLKDVLSGKLSDIVIFPNDDMAKRYFSNVCAESKIKNDLQLFRVGTFDIDTGVVAPDLEFLVGGADIETC